MGALQKSALAAEHVGIVKDQMERQQMPLRVGQRLLLTIETVVAYGWARRLTKSRPLPEALRVIRRRAQTRRRIPSVTHNPYRLAVVVQRVLALLPSDTRCLMQTVTLLTLLADRGHDGTVVISTKVAGTFDAHAWLEVNGRALLPAVANEHRLVEL